MKVSNEEFLKLAIQFNQDPKLISKELKSRYPDSFQRPKRVEKRLNTLRAKGLLPLDSGNRVSKGEVLKGTSTLKIRRFS